MCAVRNSIRTLLRVGALVGVLAGLPCCNAETADPPPSMNFRTDARPTAPVVTSDASPSVPAGGAVVFGGLDGGSRTTVLVPSSAALFVNPGIGIQEKVPFRLEGP